jgi:hypothetical protein
MQKDIAFAMDECARETTLEAMQQNNIRPFDEARSMIEITDVTIPPPDKKKKKTKKKSVEPAPEVVDEKEPEWLMFDNMNGAIDAIRVSGVNQSWCSPDKALVSKPRM